MILNKLTLHSSKSNILLINPAGLITRKIYSSYDLNQSTSFKLSVVENAKYLGPRGDVWQKSFFSLSHQ